MSRMLHWLLSAGIPLTLGSCGSGVTLAPGAQDVRIMENAAPAGARRVAAIKAVSGKGCGETGEQGSREAALDALRNEAVSLGADAVELKGITKSEAPESCNEYRAEGVAYNTQNAAVGLSIGNGKSPVGSGNDNSWGAGKKHPQKPAKLPPKSAKAKLPEPKGPAPYALGFDKPVDGCLRGYVYAQADDHKLQADYATGAPVSELWGCEWQFDGANRSQAFPGAKPGQSYAVRYQGSFDVEKSGVVKFDTLSNSAVRIVVDGGLVVENAVGAQANVPAEQSVYLGKGKHQITIEYLAGSEQLSLNVGISLGGSSPSVPFSMRPNSPFYAQQGLDYTGAAGGDSDAWRDLVDVTSEQLKLNGRIYFHTGSAELNREDESEAVLLAVTKTLAEESKIRCLEVQGHTDSRGDTNYNLRLSRERAAAVRHWLVGAGTEPHRVFVKGFGGADPVASNDTEQGRAENRRVQFVIRQPTSDGSCPKGEQPSHIATAPKRHAAPEEVARACQQSAQVRQQLASKLEPWLASHRSCEQDADCAQAVPLECQGKSKALACGWVLVNRSSVEALRSHGTRLDSLNSYCSALPEDHLVRSCGSCSQRVRRCVHNTCQFEAQ